MAVPLNFPIHPFVRESGPPRRPTLLFVAHFDHDANVTAIVRFHGDVLPLVVREVPDLLVLVVGRSPTPEVKAPGGPTVEVLGFVAHLASVYAASDLVIAPMRYGGGLTGKIAEAMSPGLPVVTNSASLQGFNMQPGRGVPG
jgi:glycosyltransferase involved in cell wall biosynthesis